MGGGEDPALMMDPANCSPVQVAGRCQKRNPSRSLPVRQLYVSNKDWMGNVIRLQTGLHCWSGCSPTLLYPAGMWGAGLTSGSETPRGAQSASAAPRRAHEQNLTQMFHPRLARWRMALWYPSHGFRYRWQSLVSEVRTSRMFTTLNEGRQFFRACQSRIICFDRKSVWFGSL